MKKKEFLLKNKIPYERPATEVYRVPCSLLLPASWNPRYGEEINLSIIEGDPGEDTKGAKGFNSWENNQWDEDYWNNIDNAFNK